MRHLHIRPAQEADIETLITYNAALAKETEGKTLCHSTLRAGIRSLLHRPSLGSYIVAEIPDSGNKQLIGQLMITYEWSDWRNGMIWWIQSVYVDPPHRRQGIYRALHQYVIEKAQREPGICGIRLYVEQNNATAKAAYQTVGLSHAGYLVYETIF